MLIVAESCGRSIIYSPAPIVVLLLLDSLRDHRRVLHILCLPTVHKTSPIDPRRFLMNPRHVLIAVRVTSAEVIGFVDHPVNTGLAATRTAALRSRLGEDELLRLTDAVHGHGLRS